MARTFASASSQYLERGAAVASAVPLTFAAWVRPVANLDYAIITLSQAGADEYHALLVSGRNVLAQTAAGGGFASAATSTTTTDGVWAHVCAVFTGAASRAVLLNGAGKGTNSTAAAPAGLNTTSIGRTNRSAPAFYADADLAEAAIWTVALTDADVAVLALGISPRLVRPDALVAYWPLAAGYSPEIDLVGHNDLPLVAAPTRAGHPRLYLPDPPIWNTARPATPAAPATGGSFFLVFP